MNTSVQDRAVADSQERTFRTRDGLHLLYRFWGDPHAATRAIVLLHRGHEHSERYEEFARQLATADTLVVAWDARGHGKSPGRRGDATHVGELVRDLDSFVNHIVLRTGIATTEVVVVGHSLSAVVLSTWVHDFAPRLRGMVLATPAFDINLIVPFALPALRLWQKYHPDSSVKSYVTSKMLTQDAEQAGRYDGDPLVSREISVRLLVDLADTSERIVKDAAAIQVPTLLLQAERDAVVQSARQHEFFANLSSPIKRHQVLKGQFHSVFHERNRQATFTAVQDFIDQLFEKPASEADLTRADETGYTYDEHRALAKPLPAFSLRSWTFKAQRFALNTVGRLSRGVQIGWQSGFDSGVSLDHVYENAPRGTTVLGRFIDRRYLDSVGWRGIRQRRSHIQRQLINALDAWSGRASDPLQILDVACGGGRYVLDALRSYSTSAPIEAELCDFHTPNLEQAEETATAWGLSNIRFVQHDAFASESYDERRGKFHIAIVSGLYELFSDNRAVARSLQGIYHSLKPGGMLIYTNQPWHPQLEVIARVLPSHRGGTSWVMRRRTQAEMDQLVRTAGFTKQTMDIDPQGIFTVATAVRT